MPLKSSIFFSGVTAPGAWGLPFVVDIVLLSSLLSLLALLFPMALLRLGARLEGRSRVWGQSSRESREGSDQRLKTSRLKDKGQDLAVAVPESCRFNRDKLRRIRSMHAIAVCTLM